MLRKEREEMRRAMEEQRKMRGELAEVGRCKLDPSLKAPGFNLL